MGAFTRIPENTFRGLQLDAGILLRNFNPNNPAVTDADIICATTGGINPQCIASYEDIFEDVDNAPNNMMEGKKLTGWDCKIATTCLGVDPETIRLALGAADKAGMRVVPRRDVKLTDFATLWWVGDRADGGFVAVQLLNGLSTGGLSLQTTKNGKGQISIEITGHVSLQAQNVVPMQFYSSDPIEYTVTKTLSHVTTNGEDSVFAGQSYLAALTPDEGYTLGTATITMGGTDITETAYDDGIIIIDEVTGNIVITCTGTAV